MTLGSSEDTVAILYDNENSPFEMLDFALKKVRHFLPCRIIVIADWEKCPEQKRWQKLMERPGFTFRQIERTRDGENSLDYALADTARMMCREGVLRFVFITTDSDFADIAKALRELNSKVMLVGIGTEQANQTLKDSYDKFICYKPRQTREKTSKDSVEKAENDMERKRRKRPEVLISEEQPDLKLITDIPKPEAELVLNKGGKRSTIGRRLRTDRVASSRTSSNTEDNSIVKRIKSRTSRITAATAKTAPVTPVITEKEQLAEDTPKAGIGTLSVHIPKTLHQQLLNRMTEENVDMNQLVTYILMQGINK